MENTIYSVVYSLDVENTLDEIIYYYSQKGGIILSNRMFDNIVSQLNELETMPFRCQVSDFSKNIRKMVIKTPPYLAYYTVTETKVIILELVHGSKNQDFIYEKYKNE